MAMDELTVAASYLQQAMLHRPASLMVTGLERTPATRALIAHSGVPCVHLVEVSTEPEVYSVGFGRPMLLPP